MTGFGVPHLGQGMPTNDSWVADRFKDLQRQIIELRAARTLDASTISPSGTLTVDGSEVVNGTLTVTGSTIIDGTLSLPAGIINNDALTDPVARQPHRTGPRLLDQLAAFRQFSHASWRSAKG